MIGELISSKWLVLALLPFAVALLVMGWLMVYTRRGRPVSLKLRGFGVSIEVDTNPGKENHG